jgi:protein-L-isoaspartate(D-aspartate) O-methyltransferase
MRFLGRDRDPGRFARRRAAMVRDQLVARGIKDPRVLEAMGEIPRERFVPHDLSSTLRGRRSPSWRPDDLAAIHRGAHERGPAFGAHVRHGADRGDGIRDTRAGRVLEIGTGSGYWRPSSPAWVRPW